MKKLLIGLLALGSITSFAQVSLADGMCEAEGCFTNNETQKLFLGWQTTKEECEKRSTLLQRALLPNNSQNIGYKQILFTYYKNGKLYFNLVTQSDDLTQYVELKPENSYNKGFDDSYQSGYELGIEGNTDGEVDSYEDTFEGNR